MRWHSASF